MKFILQPIGFSGLSTIENQPFFHVFFYFFFFYFKDSTWYLETQKYYMNIVYLPKSDE